jgi:hypothetical protein
VRFNRGVVYVAVAVIVAAVLPAGLLSADASTSAVASTAACGFACGSPFNELAGSGEVLAVSGSGSSASVVMAAASSTSTAQDWTAQEELGDVDTAVGYGIVSKALDLNYNNDALVEFQYVPGGVPSGQCLADGVTAETVTTYEPESAGGYVSQVTSTAYVPNLSVALAPCGESAQTLWILDNQGSGNEPCDLINAGYEAVPDYNQWIAPNTPASDYTMTPFAEPAVLTVSVNSKTGAYQVGLAPLSELGGVVSESQEWAGLSPQVSAALRESAAREKAAAAKAGG